MPPNEDILSRIQSLAKDETAAEALTALFAEQVAIEENRSQYFESIANLQEHLICRYDRDGVLTYANAAFCVYFSDTREGLVGRPIQDIVHTSIIGHPKRRQQLFDIATTFINDVRVQSRHGDVTWQQWIETSVVDSSGQVVEVQATAHDITIIKLAQLITRRSVEQYRSMVRNLPNTTVLVFDEEHRYLMAEGELIELLGETPESIEGRTLYDVWPKHVAEFSEPHCKKALNGYNNTLPYEFMGRNLEISYVALPPNAETGRQGMAVIRDITNIKLTTTALRESEERLSQIANIMNEVFFLFDIIEQKFIYLSDAFENIWGMPIEVALNSFAETMKSVAVPDAYSILEAIPTAVEQRAVVVRAFRLQRSDRTTRFLQIKFMPVYNNSGDAVRLAGVLEDISGEKQAEARSVELAMERERIRILTEFIDKAAHEFRTPLSIIGTNAYLLSRQAPETIGDNLYGSIEVSVDRVSTLIDRMVTMSKLDGDVDISFYVLVLGTLIRDAVTGLERMARTRNIMLRTEIDPSPCRLLGDGRLIGLALRELITNAIVFSEVGSEVLIELHAAEHHARVCVLDGGIGMSPDVMARCFQRFYRADEAHTTTGFGLGLPMARRIAEIHGGSITVDSTEGEGSTFCIQLPLIQSGAELSY